MMNDTNELTWGPEAELNWDALGIERRRRLLRAADLWDGNTYAAREWAELPKHIQADLLAAAKTIVF